MTRLPSPPAGNPVAVFMTGTTGQPYRSRDVRGPAELAQVHLTDGTIVPIPPGRPGVHMLPGDAADTLRQLFTDGIEHHWAGTTRECADLIARYEDLRDAFGLGAE